MKKISIVFNIALPGIIILLACQNANAQIIRPGIVLDTANKKCPECKEYVRGDFNSIDYLTAKNLADNYQRVLLPATSRIGGLTEDAKSVWFSLTALKAFIYSIEMETCKCKNLNLGVRIYFGRYPSSIDERSGVRAEYAKLHTLFMVPTYQGTTTDVNFDFDPWNLKGSLCPSSKYDTIGKKAILAPGRVGETRAANHGDLIPPGSPESRRALAF